MLSHSLNHTPVLGCEESLTPEPIVRAECWYRQPIGPVKILVQYGSVTGLRLSLLLLFAHSLQVHGGTVTTSTLTDVNGISGCATGPTLRTFNSCSSSSDRSFASATASVSVSQNSVSVGIAGSAWGLPESAQAYASAVLSLDFLITGSDGRGVLHYSVELSARHSGVPGISAASVYFNGGEYRVSPQGYTVVSFTRDFEYGRPFTIELGVSVRNSWTGWGGEAGTSSGGARLVSAQADPAIPEPSSVMLWLASVVTIFVASVRRGSAGKR